MARVCGFCGAGPPVDTSFETSHPASFASKGMLQRADAVNRAAKARACISATQSTLRNSVAPVCGEHVEFVFAGFPVGYDYELFAVG